MKGTPQSPWLTAANSVVGWWMGHAANEVRRQQRAALTVMTKAATGQKPKRRQARCRKPK